MHYEVVSQFLRSVKNLGFLCIQVTLRSDYNRNFVRAERYDFVLHTTPNVNNGNSLV